MQQIKLLSLNVNGIRSALKKGFLDWLRSSKPDILCLQETRAEELQLDPGLLKSTGYHYYWNSGTKLGYSGTAILSLQKPLDVEMGLGINEFDQEGRCIVLKFPEFILLNCYFPNGGRDLSRLPFKLKFYSAFLNRCQELRESGCPIIFCGDVNTSHKEIDLARPNSNRKKTGFLLEERAWIDEVIKLGYIDTFRHFYPDSTEQYTWWSNRANARENNVGWRLDYFFITSEGIENVTSAFIHPDINLSDHCPVGITYRLNDSFQEVSKQVWQAIPTSHQLKLNL